MQFTADQIAALTGGKVEGDGGVIINSVAKIEEGHPGAISFLSNPKYTHFVYQTEASAVLVSNDFIPEHPVKATLIRVADPYATVATLLQMVSKMMEPQRTGVEQPVFISEGVEIPEDAYIGAFAYIGKGVKLGKGVKIFPQVYLGDNVSIGDNTVLKPGVKVYHNCVIGSSCTLHAGVVIGGDGFGFAPTADGTYDKIPQIGNVVIEDDVEIGANTTIDRATMGSTVVAHGTKLDNLVQVAHNCVIGHDTVMAAQVGIAGSTKVGSNCMFGGQVGLAGHITIGDDVQLGAQSGVPHSLPSGSRLIGSPPVSVGDFARYSIYMKRMGDLFARVRELEKELKKLKP